MEANDSLQSSRSQFGRRRKLCGNLLIVIGVLCGGGWTLMTYFFEYISQGIGGRSQVGNYTGTILTALATIGLIAAGVLWVRAGSFADAVTAGKGLVAAGILLIFAAVAAYIIGFVVCQAGA